MITVQTNEKSMTYATAFTVVGEAVRTVERDGVVTSRVPTVMGDRKVTEHDRQVTGADGLPRSLTSKVTRHPASFRGGVEEFVIGASLTIPGKRLFGLFGIKATLEASISGHPEQQIPATMIPGYLKLRVASTALPWIRWTAASWRRGGFSPELYDRNLLKPGGRMAMTALRAAFAAPQN